MGIGGYGGGRKRETSKMNGGQNRCKKNMKREGSGRGRNEKRAEQIRLERKGRLEEERRVAEKRRVELKERNRRCRNELCWES